MQFHIRATLIGMGLAACLTQTALASRFDVLAGRTGGPAGGGLTCQGCHGAAAGSGSVQIIGAPTQYEANAVYNLTVRVADALKLGAGFQISVEDAGGNHVGTLSLLDAVNTELNSDDTHYVNHTFTGVDNSVMNWAANGNAAEYVLRWTAPASDAGTITFWAAGNAINNNSTNSGDTIYLTNQSATFLAEPVPAVSTWGLVILALAVVTAGTLLARPRSAAPCRVRT